jgi:phage replication-related protein YjqB (UPF0714/DUF867 family)
VRLELASLPIKTKEIKKLVSALEKAGLTVSITNGKHHVKVVNPTNNKVVFFGPQSLGDKRAGKNILRDLRKVGFETDLKL